MKTIPLRKLVREPLKVKRWTRAGQAVQVTDNGQPLWVIQPAAAAGDEPKRRQAVDELLDQVLREPRSPISAARLLEETRR
jgi:antitoxin (DNA-binding transcriptional repressor) of toxin-antitoxin stability system